MYESQLDYKKEVTMTRPRLVSGILIALSFALETSAMAQGSRTQTAGTCDGFALPVEQATPLGAYATFLGSNRRDFDEVGGDSRFGHTFLLPRNIVAAQIEIPIRGGAGGASNDTLNFMYGPPGGGSWGWARNLSTLSSTGSWSISASETFILDLANLPSSGSGVTNVLPMINSTGRLDVQVGDDSIVDCIVLRLVVGPSVAGGVCDNFSLPTEPATPLGQYATFLGGNRRAFDQLGINLRFGHTFSNLPNDIVDATLTVRVKAAGSTSSVANDTLNFNYSAVSGWSWAGLLSGLSSSGVWQASSDETITLDLGSLPGGPTSIINEMNASGRLDVQVGDDTAVDCVVLDLQRSNVLGACTTGSGGCAGVLQVDGATGGTGRTVWVSASQPANVCVTACGQSTVPFTLFAYVGVPAPIEAWTFACGGFCFLPCVFPVPPLCSSFVLADTFLGVGGALPVVSSGCVTIPAGVPIGLYTLQALVPDSSTPCGFVSSNAVILSVVP